VSRSFLRVLSRVLIVFSLLWVAAPSPAKADEFKDIAVGVVVGGVVLIAAIGVGIYFAVRQPRVTGCVAAGPDGKLTLQGTNPGDTVYLLDGDTTGLKAGDRVKVVAKKKKDANKQKLLLVSRVAKTYGPCSPVHALNAIAFDGLQLAGTQ
jgi:hypothetical protein